MNTDWLAGFIDGEGCFGIYKANYGNGKRPEFSLAQVDKTILEEMQRFLKMGHLSLIKSDWRSNDGIWCFRIYRFNDQKKLAEMIKDKLQTPHQKKRFSLWYEELQKHNGRKL